jgi:hypothetical protein
MGPLIGSVHSILRAVSSSNCIESRFCRKRVNNSNKIQAIPGSFFRFQPKQLHIIEQDVKLLMNSAGLKDLEGSNRES